MTGAAPVFGAIDLGASGGRVIAGIVEDDSVTLHAVHRFANAARDRDGHLRWDITGLYDEIIAGLTALANEYGNVVSIGVDTWGVDYGLLDAHGDLIAEPISYRDDRTTAAVADVHELITPRELYAVNGLQFLPFNTIYQLAAERHSDAWARTASVVMLPDLIAYWLTGELRSERTIASTTGLVDCSTGDWSKMLLDRLEIPAGVLPLIEAPGSIRGRLQATVQARTGLSGDAVVTTVAAHDTASAVAAVPAVSPNSAYVSSGTWSLVGVETKYPVLTDDARVANFTNEAGVDGTNRFLRNHAGMWLVQECMREWNASDLPEVLATASDLAADGARIDVDDPSLQAPGDMPARITKLAADCGHALCGEGAIIRCILESLAGVYASTAHQAAELSGARVDVIHVVGGGSQIELLCRLTAHRAGVPVVAGPVEATALGNIAVQARAHGALTGDLGALRRVLARDDGTHRYEPVEAVPGR